jgi:deoxyinosine 3'endonuclease (endonuclease V)
VSSAVSLNVCSSSASEKEMYSNPTIIYIPTILNGKELPLVFIVVLLKALKAISTV